MLLSITTLANLAVMIGGVWDVDFHRAVRVETFFSPPHLLIYGGMLGMLIGSLLVLALLAWDAFSNHTPVTTPLRPLMLVPLVGSGGFLAAGPFDAVWHAMFGQDALSAWTVPHAVLAIFGALSGVGAMALGRWLRAARPAAALAAPGGRATRVVANGFIVLGLAAVVYYGGGAGAYANLAVHADQRAAPGHRLRVNGVVRASMVVAGGVVLGWYPGASKDPKLGDLAAWRLPGRFLVSLERRPRRGAV
jgi:hypothetical protein